MDEDLLDVEATRRVANRALASAVLALVGGCAGVLPLSGIIILPLLAVAIVVGISAVRTLNHPEAKVIGGIRHVGIVVASIGAVLAVITLLSRIYLLLH